MAEETTPAAEKPIRGAREIGNVYAIITSKGYALAQVIGIDSEWVAPYSRIFSKLYREIPKNIEEIIQGKEDYITLASIPSMARWRKVAPQAIKLGKYDIPIGVKKPEYTRCGETRDGIPIGGFSQWGIVAGYGAMSEWLCSDYWVTQVLKKSLYDESWKEDFLKLNETGYYYPLAVIEGLERGFSLATYRPTDFHKPSRELWREYFAEMSFNNKKVPRKYAYYNAGEHPSEKK